MGSGGRFLCCFCCHTNTRGRRPSEEDGTAGLVDRREKFEEEAVGSHPSQKDPQGGKSIHWPQKVAMLSMDHQNPKKHPKKSGSVDDIIDRYDSKDNASHERAVHSDTEGDLKSKAVTEESNESPIMLISLKPKFPTIKNEVPPVSSSNAKAMNVPQSDVDELNDAPIVGLHGKYSPRSCGVDDGKSKVETVTDSVNVNRVSERVGQSEAQEGKMRHRKFLTSLVMKDSKIFDGSHKLEKSAKKGKETVKQRNNSAMDEKEKQKTALGHALEHHIARGNSYSGTHEDVSREERSHTDALRMGKEETKAVRRGKGVKGKKKQAEQNLGGASKENSCIPQKDKATTVTEESDPKRKRSRMGFLSKMLKKSKKTDGHGDMASKMDEGEFDEGIGDAATSDEPSTVRHSHQSETEEPSDEVKVPDRVHRVNFGLKLFPGDDEELKKKLESRMARIESEMNKAVVSQAEKAIDGKLSAAPDQKTDPTSFLEDSVHKGIDGDPPLLPPRLIKLTPPTPPGCETPSTEPCVVPSRLTGKEFFSGVATNDISSLKTSSKPVSHSISDEEIIFCPRDTFECVDDSCKYPVVNSATSESPSNAVISNPVSDENREIFNSTMKICDNFSAFGLGYVGGSDSSFQQTQETREKCRNSEQVDKKPEGSDSYLHLVSPREIETFKRPGTDELSLLLNELDRINSSPLQQDDIGSNRRPASEEIKMASSFEEDFVSAFPIRRRRNSDPDYDIPRSHRIPSLQAMTEENHTGEIPPSLIPSVNKSSNRENTDSIVIEATRFFGPGMDFSFDDRGHTCPKHNSDMWGSQRDSVNLVADCMYSFSFIKCGNEEKDYKGEANHDQFPVNENVGVEKIQKCERDVGETTVSETDGSAINVSETNVSETNVNDTNGNETNVSETNVSEINVSETNVSEANINEMNAIEINVSQTDDSEMMVGEININETNVSEMHMNEAQADSGQLQHAVEHFDDCVLRFGNESQETVETNTRDVTLRNSNIDRACRKERSREVYETDIKDELQLNNIMEGISISSPLTPFDFPGDESEENSVKGTAVERVSSQDQDEIIVGESGQVFKVCPDFCDTPVLGECGWENIATLPENILNNASKVYHPPESDTEIAFEARNEELCIENGTGSEIILREKPQDSSAEENKSFRLSFATTETLLVEEEVLVATLKTTTTTTTSFPPAADGSQAVEKVEEFVDEVILDLDQLSENQFDAIQVQSCIQT